MKSRFGTLLLALLFCQLGFSQTSINGIVIDGADQQPLIGAIVQVKSTGDGVVTDEAGRFTIQLKPTEEELIFRYLGYNEKALVYSGPTSEDLIVELERANTTLDEVVVSASPNNYKTGFKGSNFRISPLQLKKMNPLSTEEVLRTVPGVNIIGDMGLSNRPNISIRGSWGRRSKKVLLMEDGTPSAPAPYIAPGAYYNPVSDRITSIEVYKGADMLRFGPNNMYGGINYITALPPQKPELRVKLIGGQRQYRTGLLSYGGTWNNLGALVEGVYKQFGGFSDNSSVEVLNLNAKVFAKLSENQSLYFKVSGQFEDNQASLSSQTPFTFATDPLQNPLDADQFLMRRYGVDIIHKWLPKNNLSFTSKIYASDFERDWWRQITAKVLTSDVQAYVGDDIFYDRYAYLDGQAYGEEDYVIVGRVLNGRESTTDSRWTYTVSGLKETMQVSWDLFGEKQELEVGINLHRETFKDRFLVADSSRWARNGTITKDLWYRLWSFNGHLRNEFKVGRWGLTPIIRWEYVDMYRQDLLALAQDPNLQSPNEKTEPNTYFQLLPGLTVDYRIRGGAFYGSIYQGMIAPSKVFGFLVEQNGIVTNPLEGEQINITPELAWNKEIGWRGSLWRSRLDGQVTYFHNTSRNFYAGGRNEIFQQLGSINVQGLEAAFGLALFKRSTQQVRLLGNLNLMKSRVLSGQLVDKDLFTQIIHSTATRDEYLAMVNSQRSAFEVYVSDGAGGEVLLKDEMLELTDFDQITKSVIHFGEGGITQAEAPYTPRFNASLGLNYDGRKWAFGVNGHFVSEQYTEFHNFASESADGAIGKLPAFHTIDAFVNYDFVIGKELNATAFVNGKNITNEVYRASRLNRATSGIFGGGFRQVIFGLNLHL